MKVKRYGHSEFFYRGYDLFLGLKNLVPFTGYDLRGAENYDPFFIVGSGRSGNTLLRRILCSNSQVHIPPELHNLGRATNVFCRYRKMPWLDIVQIVLSQFEFQPTFEPFGVNLRPLAVKLSDAPSKSRNLAYILDQFYRYHAKEMGIACSRWGDKTTLNSFHLNRIKAVFPDARFVHMIRDGGDVIPSYVEAGFYPDIESAARRWLASVRAVSRFAECNLDTCLEVRYERLVQEPEETVSRVCEFLGITYDDAMLAPDESVLEKMGDTSSKYHEGVHYPISVASLGKGRSRLRSGERQKLGSLLNEQLKSLGYESL